MQRWCRAVPGDVCPGRPQDCHPRAGRRYSRAGHHLHGPAAGNALHTLKQLPAGHGGQRSPGPGTEGAAGPLASAPRALLSPRTQAMILGTSGSSPHTLGPSACGQQSGWGWGWGSRTPALPHSPFPLRASVSSFAAERLEDPAREVRAAHPGPLILPPSQPPSLSPSMPPWSGIP